MRERYIMGEKIRIERERVPLIVKSEEDQGEKDEEEGRRKRQKEEER